MKNYDKIVKHYESCFEKHGDNHLGVDWPNKHDLEKRFNVMLGIVPDNTPASVLDFGCGTGLLNDHLINFGLHHITYSGLDISKTFIDYCVAKFSSNKFYHLDVLEGSDELPIFDYIIMNGVFTEKRELSHSEMLLYFKSMIKTIFAHTNKGLAFNVMSKNVDWERAELFHLSLNDLSDFLCAEVSRNFVIRNDYGLYEYTVYLYKKPAYE